MIEELGDVRFLVAGSGTHEEQLRAQAAELGLDAHGTFLGWIGDDVLHTLYRIADLTVVPSIYEPFGLVALEAMASGCPCLVADTGGLREVVPHEEVGLRFRSRDPESLASVAVRVLADDELGRRLVARGLRASAQLRLGGRRRADSGRLRGAARYGSTGSRQRRLTGVSRIRSTRAGTPPTTAFAGTSLVTTAPGAHDRVVAHGHARAGSGPPWPIQTLLPTRVSRL